MALALMLPPTSRGAGSALGLGATLGTASRLVPGPTGSLISLALIVLALGGLVAVVASLLAPRIGWIVTATLVGLVLSVGIIATASLRTRTGPAVAVLTVGTATLAAAMWTIRTEGGRP